MAKTTMNAEASSLMLIDEATGELVFEVTEGGKEEVKEIRLKPGEGIAGWVAEHGEPLLVPDVTKDERFTVKVDEKSGFSTKSILAAPLKTKKKVIGVIEAINKIGRESFAEEEIEFFMLLANQIALAIENAKLYSYVLGEEEEPVEEPYIEAKGEKKPIGQILKEFNLITEEHLRKALEIQEREGRRRKVGQILVEELRVLTEDALNCALSHQLNIPYVTLTPEMIDPDVARLLPYDMLTRHCVIPIMRFENEIDVVMADPLDTDLISDIEKITDCTVKVSLGSKTNISEMIQQVLGPPPKIVEEKKALEEEDKGGERYLFEQIDKAISTGATELHFEPTEDVVKTRYRVGSVLHAQPDQPISIYPSLLFRAKMLAGLDLLKKDVYQKGMAESVPGITEAGFEISCGPTIYGEALTVKIIRREREALPSLADYGLEDAELSLLKRFIQNRRGVVVVGGEKGFRIRFAYSILMEADSEKRKVVTVCSQSPFKVTQFLQIPVTPSFSADDGFDMAIDQDADIVLLEEARPDIYRKVFERSFERLVFVQTPYPSTTDTLYSLFDLLDSTLIASCLNGIVGCWTESRVCSSCKGEGCEVCNLSGVLEERRLEIMDVTEKIKGCIREKMSCGRIIEEAEKEGFVLKKKIEVCNV
jgi:type IV pilus assembly protein PilB